jgi:hypothetical protein
MDTACAAFASVTDLTGCTALAAFAGLTAFATKAASFG